MASEERELPPSRTKCNTDKIEDARRRVNDYIYGQSVDRSHTLGTVQYFIQ